MAATCMLRSCRKISSSAWVVLIPSTFTCKMLMESDTTRRGRCGGDGGEKEGELEGKEGDVGGKGLEGRGG